jgi:SAM-dependent methyltransferase
LSNLPGKNHRKPSSSEEIQYWDELGARWIGMQPDRLWRAHSDAVNAAVLDAWLPRGPRGRLLKTDLFDEAAGEGLFQTLNARFRSVIGVDLSESTAGAARSRTLGHPVTCCDIRFLPFADESFDAVACISTLDHFRTREELIAGLCELRRVLRRGGHLVLTLDNGAHPIIAVRNMLPFRLLNWLGLVPYFVGVTCGPGRLRRTLRRAGFDVEAVGAALHCPRMLAVPVCRMFQRQAGRGSKDTLLRWLMRFERLSSGPLRFVTGHYVTVKAIKPWHAPAD